MRTRLLTILLLVATLAPLIADEPKAGPQRISETPEQYAERMKWFGEARFGMFIHWGVYSVPAGEYGGKTNYAEWIMESAKIPVSRYEKYADEFNPVKFDARAWVRLAREAGMKYLVITSKHHDGFGMWPSKMGDWNIGRTPFKRDPLKELSAACRAEGIKFCLYHSIMDWHSPDYAIRRPWNDVATGTPDMDRYVAYMKGQLKELITGYGPLGILWFDGEWESAWNSERGVDLYNYVRSLQPSIIVNNRVGRARAGMSGMNKGQGSGDYGTPEQEIPPTGFGPGVYWESCMTMNDHWGYNKHDQHWKSTEQLVRNLIDCASKGGNYLLNVGPTSEGLFPEASIERLHEIGRWTHANGAAIYDTQAGPFRKLPWGRCTQKSEGAHTTLYLHVFDWPTDGRLLVPGLLNDVRYARLLVGGNRLSVEKTAEGVVIHVPAEAPDKISSTVVLRINGPAQVAEYRIRPAADGSLLLDAPDAELTGNQLHTETMDGKADIGYWTEPGDHASWQVKLERGGDYSVTAETSGEADSHYVVEVDGQALNALSPNTKSYSTYKLSDLGTLNLAPGEHTITVRPVAGDWHGMNLRCLKLEPRN